MNRTRFIAWLMVVLPVALTGCGLLFTNINAINNPAPRIFNLEISPQTIASQATTPVEVRFDYFDPDSDVNLDASLVFRFQSEFQIESDLKGGPDEVWQDADPTLGRVLKTLHIDAKEARVSGEILVEVVLYDARGHVSNSQHAAIQVIHSSRAQPIGACEIWFMDQPEGSPTNRFRLGREVFLRVRDLTLGVLEPDVLYAELTSPSGRWTTQIPLYRTADPTIYTSRTGPRLGVNVPARSGQTLVAFYRAYSDRQEICLAQAKVE